MRRLAVPVTAVVAVLGLAACAGPRVPLSIGTQLVPISLILGEQAAVATAPVGPLTLPPPNNLPGIPGITVPVPPVAQPVAALTSAPAVATAKPAKPAPTAPSVKHSSASQSASPSDSATSADLPSDTPLACPTFSPITPVVGTGIDTQVGPAAATYPYRASVSMTSGGQTSAYTGPSSVVVSAASPVDTTTDSYTFTVATTAGTDTTTRTFEVIRDDGGAAVGTAEGAVGTVTGTVQSVTGQGLPTVVSQEVPGTPGIYITKVVDSTSGTFTPNPPLPLAEFPIQNGQTFTNTSSDGTTTESYTVTVMNPIKVNACGTPEQANDIEITGGKIVKVGTDGTVANLTFTESLALGTQYGGFPLSDTTMVSGTDLPTTAVTRSTSFAINVVPKAGVAIS